jgi:amidase
MTTLERTEGTAAVLAAAVQSGQCTAEDVVTAALARIAQRDGLLAAFQTVRAEAALGEARAVDARVDRASLPLAGVPVAIKDNVGVTGEVMHEGSLAMSSEPARLDHPVVARLRAAGAIVVGLTRTPELCLWSATDTPEAISRNPWSEEITCGGSSGGSAAAVAAGMVPIGHATDELGAIRLPAAACGLFGIKPGNGVVPSQIGRNDWRGLGVNGPLATTVADAALMLSVMADEPSLAQVTPPQRTVRLAVSVRPPLSGTGVSEPAVRSTFAVAALLHDAGHVIERATPQYPQRMAIETSLRWLAVAADEADDVADHDALQPRTKTHAALGRYVRGFDSQAVADDFVRRCTGFFEQFDVLITPTFADRPLPAVAWSERSWLANLIANLRATGGFPAAWNVAGFPAVNVPYGLDPRTGGPIGVQMVAAPGDESLLIGLAAIIEERAPWRRTAPGYDVG